MATINVATETTSQRILQEVGGYDATNDKVFFTEWPTNGGSYSGNVLTDNLVLSVDGGGRF